MDEIGKRPVTELALDKARQAIKEGFYQISQKQKLIKIADRLEYGWGLSGGRVPRGSWQGQEVKRP